MKYLFIVFCLFLFSCESNTYHPIFYPDPFDLSVDVRGPVFDSYDDAKNWVVEKSRKDDDGVWDYEIGVNPIDTIHLLFERDIVVFEKIVR